MDPDRRIRGAAFAAIEKLSRQHGGQIPWDAISPGFRTGGETVRFANRAKGIFKPRQMSAALSIKTTVPRSGRSPWYRDQDFSAASLDGPTGLVRYDLSRGGREDASNRALLAAMQRGAPLIYFIGISPAVYQPIFPVWVGDFRQEEGYALLATADFATAGAVSSAAAARERIEVSYSVTEARIRNHQAWFSARTKAAYCWRCAFSGLPVRELLVGAHIVPDAEGGVTLGSERHLHVRTPPCRVRFALDRRRSRLSHPRGLASTEATRRRPAREHQGNRRSEAHASAGSGRLAGSSVPRAPIQAVSRETWIAVVRAG